MGEILPAFNIRVYGILISEWGILVSDEIQYGKMITKFPGGGLQFGEGTIECVKREFLEELNIAVEVIRHFYTVDFFQGSSFHDNQQVISIYYLVGYNHPDTIKTSTRVFDFPDMRDKSQSFRWLKLQEIVPNSFSLPIDQKVGIMLRDFLRDNK